MLDKPEKSVKSKSNPLKAPKDHGLDISQSPSLQFVSTFYQSNSSDVGSTIDGLGSITIGQQTIDDAITGFAESFKVGIKVLDELAKLHPFIAAPVLAFKLVVNLDMKRRDNNAKVIAVMVQIQDMLSVLVQLRDVKETTRRGPDGSLDVTGDLKSLMEHIAEDIKQCASACDLYLKKSFLRKFLKSPVYEARLADYASKFATHHANLQLALVSLTAVRVDEMNVKLDEQHKTLVDIHTMFRELFKRLDTPKEREIRTLIDEKGSASASIDDETILKLLLSKSEDDSFRMSIRKNKEHARATVRSEEGRTESDMPSMKDIQKTLRLELLEDMDEMLRINFEMFKGKLVIQNNEIKDSIEKQGDRIISYFSGGHERIINPHIRAIWREMGWRGSIKAVDFVFALRDYFLSPPDDNMSHHRDSLPTSAEPIDQFPSPQATPGTSEPLAIDFMTTTGDEWTKQYINISHLQPILESIDDDGSGFISIREVNRFTLDCPREWSFLQWLAYWASGWHMSITQYKSKIYRLLRKMFMLLPKARRDNRIMLDDYLKAGSILQLECLLRLTKDGEYSAYDSELLTIVNDMNTKQDARMKQNLESINYKLDSISTVQLVCGTGRIDKHIYPLLYALLQHHIKIFQLSRTNILHFHELRWCTESIAYVWDALFERCMDLKATFKQMQINPDIQFDNFAFGMFKAIEMPLERQKTTFFAALPKIPLDPDEDNDVETCPDDIDVKILTYGIQNPLFLPHFTETIGILEQEPSDDTSLSGNWTGACITRDDNGSTTSHQDGLLQICLTEPSNDSSGSVIVGKGQAYMKSFEVNGTCEVEDGENRLIEMTLQYDDGFWINCRGTFNSNRSTMIGKWYSGSGASPKPRDPMPNIPNHHFNFTRTPADFVGFRYNDRSFETNPSRARWDFAMDAVRYDVKRKMMSKDFVSTALHKVLRFKNLRLREMIDNNNFSIKRRSELSAEEKKELHHLELTLPLNSSKFIYPIVKFIYERLTYHYIICNKCSRMLIQSRIFCIICRDETFDGFDLCLGCMNRKKPRPFLDYIHEESHSLIRCDYPVHDFDIASMVQYARQVSERIKSAFRTIEEEWNGSEDTEDTESTASLTSKVEADDREGKGSKDAEDSESTAYLTPEGKSIEEKGNVSEDADDSESAANPTSEGDAGDREDAKFDCVTDEENECEIDDKSDVDSDEGSTECINQESVHILPGSYFASVLGFFIRSHAESKFVCDPCDAEKLIPQIPDRVNLNKPQTKNNIMLRIVNSEKENPFERDRLIRVEKRLETVKEEMDQRLGQVLKWSETLEGKLEQRLLSNNLVESLDKRIGQLEGKVLERTNVLEAKLEEHLVGVNRASTSSAVVSDDILMSKDSQSTKLQRVEERLSDMESRFSKVEGVLADILAILRAQSDSLNG